MEENEIPYELIDNYLSGKLPEKDAREFEKRVEADPELYNEFQAHVKAEIAVRQAVRLERKEEFKREFDQLYPKGAKIRNFQPFVWVAVAAAIAFLVLLTYSLQNGTQLPANKQLFAQHYSQPEINWGSGQRAIGEKTNPDKIWARAQTAYEQGNYDEAVKQLNLLIQDTTHESHPKAYFTLGLMHLKLAEKMDEPASSVAEAQKSFDLVSDTSIFFQEAKWYKALSFLLIEDYEGCKALLDELKDAPTSSKRDAAKELLESLEKQELSS
ncbi:MAG: hypothetical protein MRZ79_10850 [Bacteroidia bacterium]|nr:hypothetical protein [Bacteroidia bacterium]